MNPVDQRESTKASSLWPARRLDASTIELIESTRAALVEIEQSDEQERRLSQPGVDALQSAGLFGVSLPRELGGWEAEWTLEFEVFEAVSRISTAACWNLFIGNFNTALPAVFCSDEAVKEMVEAAGEGAFPVVAGQPVPRGKARLVDGGMVVSGRYGWGSGIAHSGFVFGGCTVEQDGDSGSDKRVWVAPKSEVHVLDNWHVQGLIATGSSDYFVEDLFVADGWWFPSTWGGPVLEDESGLRVFETKRGGKKYEAPPRLWLLSGHTALVLGAAERAFAEIASLASRKRRSSTTRAVADREVFRHDLGSTFVALSATRDNALRLFSELDARVGNGEPVTVEFAHQLIALAAHAARTATATAQMAYGYGGGDSVWLTNPLQRILRDLQVAQQHAIYSDSHFEYLGEMLVKRFRGEVDA